MDTLVIWGVAAVLVATIVLPYWWKHRKLEKHAFRANEYAREYGLDEPASLHPVVDANSCIGTGNCVAVCPEHDVLGLMHGQARPVSPARCIGHGLCERACPVDAIQLVFGTEKRGVDIPRIRETFETNVPGIYIVGELGGMGLIRNAFEQGRQCIESIVAANRQKEAGELDVVIVGCGPAGLSASLNCIQRGLDFVVIDKEEDVGGTVRTYPRKKLVMTHPLVIPGFGKLDVHEIVKEDLIGLWDDIISSSGLKVRTGETAAAIHGVDNGSLELDTNLGTYRARNIILAIGRRGVPRKLGVEGEHLSKVAYSLREAEEFQGDRVLVVGGGDSAVEAALALSEVPGTEVHISYRRDKFSRIKPGNHERIEAAIGAGRVVTLFSTNVTEILREAILLHDGNDEIVTLANDYVFVFAGGVLPTDFLTTCGIQIDTKFGEPAR